MLNKNRFYRVLGAIGSISSIVGIVLYFVNTSPASSEEVRIIQNSGDNSIQIGESTGRIVIKK